MIVAVKLIAWYRALKVAIVLGKEVRAFRSFAAVQRAAEAAVCLSRQSEGWLRSQRGDPQALPHSTRERGGARGETRNRHPKGG